jgi:hypothetical protein
MRAEKANDVHFLVRWCALHAYGYSDSQTSNVKQIIMCGNPHKGNLSGGLSGVRGNSHAPFLGGLGMATSPGYPTCDTRSHS